MLGFSVPVSSRLRKTAFIEHGTQLNIEKVLRRLLWRRRRRGVVG